MNFTGKKVLIIGGSSGIGLALTKQLISRGAEVAVVGKREPNSLKDFDSLNGKILYFSIDVADVQQAESHFLEITRQLGGLDIVYYCAGVMPVVEMGEFDLNKDQAMIDVNVLAMVAWLNQAAMRFAGAGRGTIVGISSVAGERGRALNVVYNASKAFQNSYLESLRNRVSSLGVRVVTVKPGPVDTPMSAHLSVKKAPVDAVAAKIIKLSGRNGSYFVSPVHAVIFCIIRHVPSFIFRRLKL